jgi:hypothetical protein
VTRLMGVFSRTATVLFCIVGLSTCGGGAFRGNGLVTDNGRMSYPRYEIAMRPSISLRRSQVYTFEFSGMPRDEMDFGFRPTSRVSERTVRSHAATLRSTLRRADSGKVIGDCAISTRNDTLTASSSRDTGEVLRVWSAGCVDVRFDPTKTYSLTVAVEVFSESTGPQFEVEAVFRGGGIELP